MHFQKPFRVASTFVFCLGFLTLAFHAQTALAADASFWSDVADSPALARQARVIVPDVYRTVELDVIGWEGFLSTVPGENTGSTGTIVGLPMPDGSTGRFSLVESPVMEPGLAAKFPEIQTFVGQGIDDPDATVRLDWTPAGFHAQILSPNGAIYIDPYSPGQVRNYVSYKKRDYRPRHGATIDLLPPLDPGGKRAAATNSLLARGVVSVASGDTLRTYRLAMAADGEYSTFHGGTVPAVAAELVTLVNRVTGIYEVEIASRLVLVANNDLLIYLDAGTDPYSNEDAFALLGENQVNVDSVIGTANYDVGHVVTTGGGGLAFLGVVCNSSAKAGGETGLSSPVGDPFYVDFVAHELGHQFAGSHTWNGKGGSCSSDNHSEDTAYEPGSGSTIQAYAGICGSSNNLQANSDPYFHTLSFDEMIAHTTVGSGSACGTTSATGNSAPVPDAGAGGFTIPSETPFTLTGAATDPDFDALTYNWEQFDLGPQGVPQSPTGNAPIFRSFSATTTAARTFPRMSDILGGTSTIGEILPTKTRDLTFRLTVRDNRAGGGGVAHDEMAFSVDGGAGPFVVTSPVGSTAWASNLTATVLWDIADTDSAPVNCSTVDILFSSDSGATFATVLADDTPNDGSESIAVPNVVTSQARVLVECVLDPGPGPAATFFNISEGGDFSLVIPVPAACPATPALGCLTGGRASIQYNEKKAGKEKMKLKLTNIEEATVQGDFGDPVNSFTEVALCIYDDFSDLVQEFVVARAGDTCAGKPCWKAKGTKGYGYKDKDVATQGVAKIGLKSGDAGKGKADALGKNNVAKGQTSLPLGVVAALGGNVSPTIQLITGEGVCVGATMNTLKKDDGLIYIALKK
ncbi:MAG: hypothetical protein ACI8TX_000642 [Hyphomicrobiaceae bacterium]|jgi:hypothetical protein